MNHGFEASEGSEPDQSLEAAVRRVFEDLSREEFGEPVDVFAVTRDDELLDWLGAVDLDAEPAPPAAQDPADAELIEMLLAWRRSVTTDASEPALPRPPRAADAPGRLWVPRTVTQSLTRAFTASEPTSPAPSTARPA